MHHRASRGSYRARASSPAAAASSRLKTSCRRQSMMFVHGRQSTSRRRRLRARGHGSRRRAYTRLYSMASFAVCEYVYNHGRAGGRAVMPGCCCRSVDAVVDVVLFVVFVG